MNSFPLEPIEKASIDELRALQLERLKATLAHAYANSPRLSRPSSTRPACIRRIAARWPTSRSFRSPPRRTCATTIPSACSPCRGSRCVRIHASAGTTGKPTVVGYTRKDIDTWAHVMARSHPRGRRAARRHRAREPTATACSPAASARTTAPRGSGCTVMPVRRRPDRAPGAADQRFPARHHHGHAQLHAGDRRRDRAAGAGPARVQRCASASSAPSPGPTTCATRSSGASAWMPWTSTACRK